MKMTLIRIERILNKLLLLKEKAYLRQEPELKEEEVWLDNQGVMNLLKISPSSFYRKVKECAWKKKKIVGRTFYLKSSILEPSDS
ncbi:hypothetical protein [Pedobacter gandavensis]|uniref:DNA-binding protein n=1 Tax=Pedobacter gandavensis TaxID=2679963 RepID=A0ABR6EZ45_9SPHI|nr:hypothetical protein [Pedobacter gandavensis]MBB2150545.1 hypothetical protein [Pedobacter gandavensis]